MDAVALAYLNYQRHAHDAQSEARQHYVAALRLTHKAIQDPELVKKDSTLLAILLLDLYEKITSNEPLYEGAWAAHLQGALTLVRLRGEKQFDDPTAIRMLNRLITNEIISCVASNRPVSQEIIELRAIIACHAPADPKSRESDLMIDLARLRHELDKGVVPEEEAVRAIKDLDDRFLALSMDVLPTWQFKTIRVKDKSSHHWDTYHHLHPYEQIAQMWNVLRITRLLLNEAILSHCSRIDEVRISTVTARWRVGATETIESMATDICATVPQYIGDLSSGHFHRSGSPPAPNPRPSMAKQTTSPNPTQPTICRATGSYSHCT